MYKWSDFGIQTEENKKDMGVCPKCQKKSLEVNYEKSSWFCYNCGFSGSLFKGTYKESKLNINPYNPNLGISKDLVDPSFKLTEGIIKSFKNRGISEKTLNLIGVKRTSHYFPQKKKLLPCVVYPYTKNNILCNNVYISGDVKDYELGGIPVCFNFDQIEENQVIITLNEIDALSIIEAGINSVISFIHYEDKNDFDLALSGLELIEEKLDHVKKIIFCLPKTEYASSLMDEILRRLGREKCWVANIDSKYETVNNLLLDLGEKALVEIINQAKPVPIRGVFEVTDVEDGLDVLYFKGLKRGESTGFTNSLDHHYTVLPGQWTVVTGIPGHGKSNLLDQIMVNLAKNAGWKFGIFSPEHQPIERHFASIMEKLFNKPFDIKSPNRIDRIELMEGKKWLENHFSIVLPHEDDSWNIDGILSLAKTLVYRKGIKGFVIDPWNEIEHSRPNNQTETEYVSSVLSKIRKFARKYGVHVWLVAHPAKLYKDKDGKYPVPTPYDISGSAHYRNKADNCITVWRNVGYLDQNVADIHVQKIKLKEVGKVGIASLRFCVETNSYVDDIDQEKRIKALETGAVLPIEKLIKNHFFGDY